MTWNLIKDKYEFLNWRIYKRDTPIKLWKRGDKIVNIEEEYNSFKKRYNENVAEQLPQKFDIVIVSDAHDHPERLCFLANTLKEKSTGDIIYDISYSSIGRNTGMFYHFAGDERAIKDDKVYLRFIDMINRRGE